MTADIAAFIRARLDEDEQIARAVRRPTPWHEREPEEGDGLPTGIWVDDPTDEGVVVANGSYVAGHVIRHDPVRVLRGVEAKRRILDEHLPFHVDDEDETLHVRARMHEFGCRTCHYSGLGEIRGSGLCMTIRLLASEWSTHQAYRQEWAP